MAEATAARYGLFTRSLAVTVSDKSYSAWNGSGLVAVAGIIFFLTLLLRSSTNFGTNSAMYFS